MNLDISIFHLSFSIFHLSFAPLPYSRSARALNDK